MVNGIYPILFFLIAFVNQAIIRSDMFK